ncbi:Glycosyl transferase family 2 [Verrucomicrobia bacterium]|nr:Glycosyl transferase family 2 [Verrucomicrobiota bacterium]
MNASLLQDESGLETAQSQAAPARNGQVRAERSNAAQTQVATLISVLVNNYNGAAWLERCLTSLRAQSISEQIEVIVADNASPDGSGALATALLKDWPNGRVLQNAADLGYCESNNRAAKLAKGRYLLVLNNDTWLEPDCLERLLAEVEEAGAVAATPLVLDYVEERIHSAGEAGFDVFGFLSHEADGSRRRELFVATGCSVMIDAEVFRRLGGFDTRLVMYADEYDLCWRVWLAGGKIILAPSARLHHRGAAGVNPRGTEQVIELRTSDSKRFYANRNNLLVLLKNSQHLLLVLVPLQILLLTVEALAMSVLTRRWSHLRRAYFDALWDCWQLRGHIRTERRRLRALRQHGDFWMLRFLRGRLNRWGELQRFLRFGLPKVDPK